jgi:hypothetical protein
MPDYAYARLEEGCAPGGERPTWMGTLVAILRRAGGNMPDKQASNQNPNQKQTERQGRQNVEDESDAESGDESADLKEREYRGPDGEIHHHTKKYMEQHQGETEQSQEGSKKEGSKKDD